MKKKDYQERCLKGDLLMHLSYILAIGICFYLTKDTIVMTIFFILIIIGMYFEVKQNKDNLTKILATRQ